MFLSAVNENQDQFKMLMNIFEKNRFFNNVADELLLMVSKFKILQKNICSMSASNSSFVTGGSALIIPEELPSILSVIYSNIPPIKKGLYSVHCIAN
jgi:hypothetical protein